MRCVWISIDAVVVSSWLRPPFFSRKIPLTRTGLWRLPACCFTRLLACLLACLLARSLGLQAYLLARSLFAFLLARSLARSLAHLLACAPTAHPPCYRTRQEQFQKQQAAAAVAVPLALRASALFSLPPPIPSHLQQQLHAAIATATKEGATAYQLQARRASRVLFSPRQPRVLFSPRLCPAGGAAIAVGGPRDKQRKCAIAIARRSNCMSYSGSRRGRGTRRERDGYSLWL